MGETRADYDSAWKEALERFFEQFVAFFFPQAHAGIDWSKGYEFLDKELRQVVRDAELGRRLADKLVKVWSKDGEEAWVLVHIEVQEAAERAFAKRMYIYNYRIFDRYDRKVASLAVLADSQPAWRPNGYGYELWGCRVGIEFPVVKLLDYETRWSELQQNPNPFAIIVMAHLKAQATSRDAEGRLHWKLRLVKMLYQRGHKKKDILELFHFIDWLMVLPEELEFNFTEALRRYEEEVKMPYVTSVERRGIKKGIQQGIQQGIIEILETRFESCPASIVRVVNRTDDLSTLKMLLKKAATIGSLQDYQAVLEE
ncbi:MAG: hypothetical protein WCA08_08060, partial [Desulfoferrobacter sp.]